MNTHDDRQRKPLRLREVMMGAFGLLLAACASIGTPDGGRYDEEPPYVVKSRPQDRAFYRRHFAVPQGKVASAVIHTTWNVTLFSISTT